VAFKMAHGPVWGFCEHGNEISVFTKGKQIEWLREYQILIPIDVVSHTHTHMRARVHGYTERYIAGVDVLRSVLMNTEFFWNLNIQG
jgi:hypothetical protein